MPYLHPLPSQSSLPLNGVTTQPLRVPTLRNIALSGPYMHDGRFLTLEAVVDHYIKLFGLTLSVKQKADLVAYLKTL